MSDVKIYFSASIRGANPDPALASKVVSHLQGLGHVVLSEHVAGKDSLAMNATLLEKTWIDRNTLSEPESSQFIRRVDMQWVDEATHFVAVITGPSLGVGMEIERAVLKPRLGMNNTPIYCFVPEEYLPQLSGMVRGIVEPVFQLFTYKHSDEILAQLSALFADDNH